MNKIYYDPADPYQGYGDDAPRRPCAYQPIDQLDFIVSLSYVDFYRSLDKVEGLRLPHPAQPQHLPGQQVPVPARHRRVQRLLQADDARRPASRSPTSRARSSTSATARPWSSVEWDESLPGFVAEQPLPRDAARLLLQGQLPLEALAVKRRPTSSGSCNRSPSSSPRSSGLRRRPRRLAGAGALRATPARPCSFSRGPDVQPGGPWP
ncbi:MAG: hypothetical protein M0C28_40325 [Candidatus Moduliflexus flocculans]|nr:hypothetical protein [Candidatus Moduliflexus flocculans]